MKGRVILIEDHTPPPFPWQLSCGDECFELYEVSSADPCWFPPGTSASVQDSDQIPGEGSWSRSRQARVHGASKSQTRLSMCTHTCAHAHTHTHTSECQPPSEGPGSGIRRQARAGLDSDCRRGLTHSLPEGKAAAALVVLSAECSSQAAAFTALYSPSSQSYGFSSGHVCM